MLPKPTKYKKEMKLLHVTPWKSTSLHFCLFLLWKLLFFIYMISFAFFYHLPTITSICPFWICFTDLAYLISLVLSLIFSLLISNMECPLFYLAFKFIILLLLLAYCPPKSKWDGSWVFVLCFWFSFFLVQPAYGMD